MSTVSRSQTIRVLRDAVLDADAAVDEARRDLDAAAAWLWAAVAKRDDLVRQLADLVEAAA